MSECIKLHYWVLDLERKCKFATVFWVDALVESNEDGYWTIDIEKYCKYLKADRKELNKLLRLFKEEGLIEYERIGRKKVSVYIIDWDSYQC